MAALNIIVAIHYECPFTRSPPREMDFGLRLPLGWREKAVADRDCQWIGHTLFAAKSRLVTELKLWWHPPHYRLPLRQPSPGDYHRRRMLLWMPRRMWQVQFTCPNCSTPRPLRSKGLYGHIRTVIDLKDMYYLAGEYMDCNACSSTFISWDKR